MKKIAIFILSVVIAITTFAAIPKKTNRLVNDYAGLFTPVQLSTLEQYLVAFADTTSNQILIVTTPDLDGYSISDYAFKIGEEWGVGQAEHDNGLVIVIKPKNDTKGQVFIATGYGLEGVLPDAVCKEIVDLEMIPYFRDNNYYAGVVAALNIIMPVAAGEYSYNEARYSDLPIATIIIVAMVVFALVLSVSKKGGSDNNNFGGGRGNGGIDPFTALWLGSMVGRNHSGSFGNFSGGSGGFGGFGGGSFGGGGAGGSW